MKKLRAAFPEANDKLALVQLDISDEALAKAAVSEAVERFGRIDVLVNNAGNCVLGSFEGMSAADIRRQFDVNFFGVVNVLHAALPVMRKQRAGHVINISSVAGVVGLAHCSAYGASKFAVEGLSMAVANEVEPFGIHMTLVEPGFFRTSLLDVNNAGFIDSDIDDYKTDESTQQTWSAYDGTQQGNPLKLGHALVKISEMKKPLKLFVAGSDALETITPVLEARLAEMRGNAELSKSTDGVDD
nr:SDR family NAD(P)-dependent oxidoreductase [Pseudomonas syringae group genomosp. 3]